MVRYLYVLYISSFHYYLFIIFFFQAMLMSHGAHDHEGWYEHFKDHEEQHSINLWRGFLAVMAVVFFYFTEKIFSVISEYHKKRQRKNKV